MTFSALVARILNRLGILPYVNFIARIYFNGRPYRIPVLRRVGFGHLYIHKDYDYQVYNFFRSLIGEGIFLDVGASIGQTILKIGAINPNTAIVSVEPNANCLYYLNELKHHNNLSNLTIVPCALYDNPGLKRLFVMSSFDTSASLITSNQENYIDGRNYYFVNTINGNQLLDILPRKVSFIKIDVEGAEVGVMSALKDVIDRDKPIIYCEVLDAHSEEARQKNRELKGMLFSFVRSLNYDIFFFVAPNNELVKLREFPDRVYTSRNLDACNYLFLPVER